MRFATTRAGDYLPSFTLIILIIIIVTQWIPNMTAGREVAACNVQSLATENTTMVSSTKATLKFLILGAHIPNNHSGQCHGIAKILNVMKNASTTTVRE